MHDVMLQTCKRAGFQKLWRLRGLLIYFGSVLVRLARMGGAFGKLGTAIGVVESQLARHLKRERSSSLDCSTRLSCDSPGVGVSVGVTDAAGLEGIGLLCGQHMSPPQCRQNCYQLIRSCSNHSHLMPSFIASQRSSNSGGHAPPISFSSDPGRHTHTSFMRITSPPTAFDHFFLSTLRISDYDLALSLSSTRQPLHPV